MGNKTCLRLPNPALKRTIPDRDPVTAVALTSAYAVSAHSDGTVQVWELTSQRTHLLSGYEFGAVAVTALAGDGRYVLFGGGDGFLRIQALLQEDGKLHGRAFDPEPAEPMYTLNGLHSAMTSATLSRSSRYALSGHADGAVQLWDVVRCRPLRDLGHHPCEVTAVALSADGQRAVSGDAEGEVRLWTLDTKPPQPHLGRHSGRVTAMAMSANGRYAVSGGIEGIAQVWTLTAA